MSKQYPMEEWAPQNWLFMAKGYYLQMLRDAAVIERLEHTTRPQELVPAAAQLPSDGGLFRFGRSAALSITCTNPSTGTVALPNSSTATTATATATDAEGLPQANPMLYEANDVVTEEAERWVRLDKWSIREVTDVDGVVNEMALLYKLRREFPLHFRVFKQVSSHIPHEANTERLFSLAGNLSDDNTKMCPDNLATWTSVGANMNNIYLPSVDQVMKRYFLLFSNAGPSQHHVTAQPDA